MIFRNSKLELMLSILTACFNALISLVLLSLLTDWPLAIFAVLLLTITCLYSGFAALTWQAERIELTPTQLLLTFGLTTKATKSFARQRVHFTRLRTKWFHQAVGLVRCQLELDSNRSLTLTLRSHTALKLEQQLSPTPHKYPQGLANPLIFAQLPAFILNENTWLRRSANIFCLFFIGGMLLSPQQLLALPLWNLCLGFIALSLIVWISCGVGNWLQSRYFAFSRDGDTFIVQRGFLTPLTTTFTLADCVVIEQHQTSLFKFHRQATISVVLAEVKQTTKKAIILAPIIPIDTVALWFEQYFPEIEQRSRQYRPQSSAWLSFALSLSPLLTIGIGLSCLFLTTPSNLTLYLSIFCFVLALVFLNQYLLWQSSFLCQLPDFFIISSKGIRHYIRYYQKQYTRATISQSRYQAKRELGTFQLQFPQQPLPRVTFPGIAHKKQA
ncbi:MAG: hypothetical protein ACRDCC_07645 [Culicoidibacterales bacterium]